MKLLLVEDNRSLAERITAHIPERYTVDIVGNGEDAVVKVGCVEYALIVLDLGLPGMSGFDVCREVRKLGYETPILILTAVDDTPTKVTFLNSGADDYMTKPFDSRELAARIEALGRRQPLRPVKRATTIGDLVVDHANRTVSRAGIPITLRRKEFDILEYLVSNAGRIVTRDMILNNVWESDTSSWANTVDVHIKNLRDRIDRPFATSLIKTAYGIGYRVEVPQEVTHERKTRHD